MMAHELENTLKSSLLREAVRIGEKLAERPVRAGHLRRDCRCGAPCCRPESIACGLSGRVLYLVALYRATQDARWLPAVEAYCTDLAGMAETTPTDNFGFYNGRAGLAYALLEASRVLAHRQGYLVDRALAYMRAADGHFLDGKFVGNGLGWGRSGTMLVLLHLHARTGAGWLAESIGRYAGKLVREASQNRQGLCWDRSYDTVKGACGFASGAAGIAFALLQLAAHPDHAAFAEAGRLALQYVDAQWSETHRNYPDYHRDPSRTAVSHALQSAFRRGAAEAFLPEYDNFSWAQGLAGIGLAKVMQYQVYGEREVLQTVDRIADLVSNRAEDDFSLFHGGMGHALFLLAACPHTGRETHRRAAARVLEKALGRADAAPAADLSLSHGITGWGYGCLQFLHPDPGGVLFPALAQPARRGGQPGATPPGAPLVAAQLRKNLFPQTLQGTGPAPGESLDYESLLADTARAVAASAGGDTPGLFGLECALLEKREQVDNTVLLHYREIARLESARQVLSLPDEALREQTFTLAPGVEILHSARDRDLAARPDVAFDARYPDLSAYFGQTVLAWPSSRDTVAWNFPGIETFILREFERPNTIPAAVAAAAGFLLAQGPQVREQLSALCELEPGENLADLLALIIDNLIKEYISTGILAEPARR